jgi:hypothetical protein
MGLNLSTLINLQAVGLLGPKKNRLLDIGPQNVFFVTEEKIRAFVSHQGQSVSDDVLASEIKRLVYFSTPREGERMTFLSEITDLTNIEYASIDICPGLKTDIVDLNFEQLPEKMRGRFDVVLNFGTSEHIFNQWNCFQAMHDAAGAGGTLYCQLPGSGYLDHGYFCYTPLFFRDLAKANRYETAALFFQFAGENYLGQLGIDVRSEETMGIAGSNPADAGRGIPCFNVHAILKKTVEAPFKCALEISTAHAAANPFKSYRYSDDGIGVRLGQAARYYKQKFRNSLRGAKRSR